MNQAFADYPLPMQLTQEAFDLMMRMRGLAPDLSHIVCAGGEVVAFWLVGARGDCAYLISSGTLPQWRRSGFSQQLGKAVIAALGACHIQTLQCEVLTVNASARALYKRLGFAEMRDLTSYRLPALKAPQTPGNGEGQTLAAIPKDAQEMWDITPSWQNSIAALRVAGDAAVVLACLDANGPAGYAAFVPKQNTLAQFAVRKDRRRQGLARMLIPEGRRMFAPDGLRMINVDQDNKGMVAFLQALSAEEIASQKELLLKI